MLAKPGGSLRSFLPLKPALLRNFSILASPKLSSSYIRSAPRDATLPRPLNRQPAARFYARVRHRPILRKNLADIEPDNVAPDHPPTTLVPAAMRNLLSVPTLVIERQIEFFNILAGFEQGNKYKIYDANGQLVGFMEETDNNFTRAILRQVYRLHRPFTVNVYNLNGEHALTIHRPFSFINSHIMAVVPGGDYKDPAAVIGESRQEWHLWRRRYNLYLQDARNNEMDQFARVDSGFLAFDFPALDEESRLVGAVDRNWVGIGREMFTDTGVYVLRMGQETLADLGKPLHPYSMSLEQRAVMLAMAVSVDFDYFSRHSNRTPGGFFYDSE